jgi:hypothetical protein
MAIRLRYQLVASSDLSPLRYGSLRSAPTFIRSYLQTFVLFVSLFALGSLVAAATYLRPRLPLLCQLALSPCCDASCFAR